MRHATMQDACQAARTSEDAALRIWSTGGNCSKRPRPKTCKNLRVVPYKKGRP